MTDRLRYGVVFLCSFTILAVGCSRDPAVNEAKHLARGKKYFAQKDYQRAILEFRTASQFKAQDAEPWYQLGISYLAAKQIAQAVPALRKATELNPNHKDAQLRLAELMVQSQQPEVLADAVKRLDQVLAVDPGDPDVLDTLAIADLRLRKPEDASKLLQQALEKFPAHLRSSATLAAMQFLQHDPQSAEGTLQKAVAQAPKSADAALALAHLYVMENKKPEAEAQLQRALQIDPANARALMSLGAMQLDAGETAAADQTYRRLAALPNANLSYVHAAFLYRIGKKDEATAELEKLARSQSGDRSARLRLAAAYAGTGRRADAMKYLAALLQKDSKDADALLLRSRLYLDAGQVKEAERDLQSVQHVRPDSPDMHYGLSRVYGLQGLERNRRDQLSDTLRIDNGLLGVRIELAKSYIAAGQATGALQVLDAAPAMQKSSLRWLGARNWALLGLNRLDEAEVIVAAGLARQRNSELLLQHGLIRAIKKDFAGARADAEEILKTNSANISALSLAIRAAIGQRQLPAALAILRESAAKNDRSPLLQTAAGEWLEQLGQPGEARVAFDRAKSINPHYAPAELALASLDAKQGSIDSARRTLAAVISAEPRNEGAHLLLASIEYQNKNLAGALAEYQKVVELNPDNVVALNGAGYLLAAQDGDTALKYAQHALELAPGNPNVEDTLGCIYYRKGLYQKAANFLSQASAAQPTAVHEFHLAMSYSKVGDFAHAQDAMAKALAKDPNVTKTESGW
ncbi:MAG TPA: tetratricopeptide repeat protein [Bryobacteraceae bacterium]|nr:tetratricopeptide repeat protein [Bryobacteraceae bacterium]